MSSSGDSQASSSRVHEATVPADILRGHSHPMAMHSQPAPAPETRSSSETATSSLRDIRTARYATATTVQPSVTQTQNTSSPFTDPPSQSDSQHDVGDVGFGYVAASDPARHASHSRPPASPLKSALKSPGIASRLNPLSPTFREEYMAEKEEKSAEKENARDLKIKLRVRIAKVFLRFVSFGCSLIVIAILATTLMIFQATKDLPRRNGKPSWAPDTNPWPQYLLISMAAVSLFACLIVFYGYWRGGHKRAQKTGMYYTIFSVCFFVFSLIMWIVGAVIYKNSRATGGNQDLWGWACVHNIREEWFHDTVDYRLACRLQDWGLICAVIEVIVEVLVLVIYAVIFYRFYTKKRLMRTMDRRDKARSDLYLAQLRHQSAPNTPGFPRGGKHPYGPIPNQQPMYQSADNGDMKQAQYAAPTPPSKPPAAFQLQAPPIRVQYATPKAGHEEFSPPAPAPSQGSNGHSRAAPGEQTYESIPVPGAYGSPINPNFPPDSRQ